MNGLKASRSNAIIGFSGALLLPILLVLLSKGLPDSDGWLYFREIIWWLFAAVIAFWALRVEGLFPAGFGFRKPAVKSVLLGVGVGLAAMFTIGLCYALIIPALGGDSDPSKMQELAKRPIPLLLFLSLTAGVVEEWLFRFYAIDRLHFLSKNKWLASIIPGVVFIGLHAPGWGLSHLIPVTLLTVIFTAYYWWKRDFWSSALAHFITDAIPFVMFALALQYGR
ncbi:CPBP family intramembrane glutamic endopeptidase [Parasphingorhabdus halotolerans]|uniref:CPBP family intramembrane metalloprotease n=1 Tax=Parasphingorhabdus halotolerans TaxID=2725558 RepID=A0A6H2DQJ9_9SPHN|nr:CPBP family intramembrane glutamic endopeptidase [Parasphingorhabdus halotolerans]QJB70407.1 CPBP family intramembrane metalloprotease [Parasphingorhabdus halotolerans]